MDHQWRRGNAAVVIDPIQSVPQQSSHRRQCGAVLVANAIYGSFFGLGRSVGKTLFGLIPLDQGPHRRFSPPLSPGASLYRNRK